MMLEGVGDRPSVALDEASRTTNHTAAKPPDMDRATESVVRPTSVSPAAEVKLSAEGKAALRQGADTQATDDEDRPPPAPQKKRVEAQPSEALARYRQVADDPASIFLADGSPFLRRAGTGAPIDASAPQLDPPPQIDPLAAG